MLIIPYFTRTLINHITQQMYQYITSYEYIISYDLSLVTAANYLFSFDEKSFIWFFRSFTFKLLD